MDISNKKYVSFAFLDAIDVGASKIVGADNQAQAIINDSKNYNISPATLALVKGETDVKSGFRAYVKLTLTQKTYDHTNWEWLWYKNNLWVIQHPVWMPLSVDIELFSFGVNSDYSSVTFVSYKPRSVYSDGIEGFRYAFYDLFPGPNGYALLFVFLLNEAVAVNSRMYLTNGLIRDSKAHLTENTFCFITPVTNFAIGRFDYSQQVNIKPNNLNGIVYTDERGIGMISNGQNDGVLLSPSYSSPVTEFSLI